MRRLDRWCGIKVLWSISKIIIWQMAFVMLKMVTSCSKNQIQKDFDSGFFWVPCFYLIISLPWIIRSHQTGTFTKTWLTSRQPGRKADLLCHKDQITMQHDKSPKLAPVLLLHQLLYKTSGLAYTLGLVSSCFHNSTQKLWKRICKSTCLTERRAK